MPVLLPPTTSTKTVLDWIEETRGHLLSGAGEQVNVLDGALTASQTTVTLLERPLPTGIAKGTVISAELEAMRVWEVLDANAGTVRVLRGYQGSTPAAHGDGLLVRYDAPHSDWRIFRALQAEVSALSGEGLWRLKLLDFTTSSTGVRTYDTASDVDEGIDLRVDWDTTANQWPLVKSWTILHDALGSEFPSGVALRVDSYMPTGRPARLRYKAPLGQITDLDDNAESATGLEPSALDIPPVGAAWRLSMPAEVERNQTRRQGDSRRAEEVPPGAKLRAPLGLAQVRAIRVRAEIDNLRRKYPVRRQ